jgi:hypothetical protein
LSSSHKRRPYSGLVRNSRSPVHHLCRNSPFC